MMADGDFADVLLAMAAIAKAEFAPSAPDRFGAVPRLRRDLDMAVLKSLGLAAGQATILVERVYASTGRWRASIEDVEDAIQANRRSLAKRGGARHMDPVVRVVRTVIDEMKPNLPTILSDFGTTPGLTERRDPSVHTAQTDIQAALFAEALVLDAAGNPVDLGDVRRLNFAILMRRLGVVGPFAIPVSPGRCEKLQQEIEAAQLQVRDEAVVRASKPIKGEGLDERVGLLVVQHWVSDGLTALKAGPVDVDVDVAVAGEPPMFDTMGLVPPLRS